ncbi:MAG: hypothetical protein JST85_10990 [Acidobacteria bacterium]|nr:hypothetical protein [Acidobacteriota bacterium]
MSVHHAKNNALDRECLAFSNYLVKQRPNDYVIGKYREAHAMSDAFTQTEEVFFDRLLLGASSAHPVAAKLVDAYTAIFRKKSAVRRKWILLLAILESCAPTHVYFDNPDSGGRAKLVAGLAWRGLIFILALGVSIVIFMPFHITGRLWRK